jgi:hypothetical protein
MNKKENINKTLQSTFLQNNSNNILHIYYKNNFDINTKIPIRRGCPNNECFCTGKCNEIISWRNRFFNEF